jgi:hypothetical protein
MLSQQIECMAIQVYAQWALLPAIQLFSLTILAGTIILWLGWRAWKFTIVPKLNPLEPRLLPYWNPCEFLRAFTLLNDANLDI